MRIFGHSLTMPIYMDIHNVPGIEAIDAAEAHRKDMLIQQEHQCKCMTYWVDSARGVAFCLIEGPDKASVEEMHRKSHGLVPNKIIEVKNDLVESFLGRIHDPEDAAISDTGLKVISEPALRVLLMTEFMDPVLLRHQLGTEKANELLTRQYDIIRKECATHAGREIQHVGDGFMASFSVAANAVTCALTIQTKISAGDRKAIALKLAVTAGEPVANSEKLFGDTIQLGGYLCTLASINRVVISSWVRDLLAADFFQQVQNKVMTLQRRDQAFVQSLFHTLEDNWQDTNFDMTEFCQALAMSKSRLYRATMALWGIPPNGLLKEFRLEKALELLKKQSGNIAQTTFDSGFSSPSYFTKCFKLKFGLLPAVYLDALH
jgi:AraC-like DNA-binding protein